MKRFNLLFAFVLIASMPFIGAAGEKSIEDPDFKAELSGAKVPPVATRATGEATFDLIAKGERAGTGGTVVEKDVDKEKSESGAGPGGAGMGDALKYELKVKNIENVTAAHLHMGKGTTAEGPVIAPLFTGPRKAGEFSGVLAQGTLTAKDLKGPLSGKSVDELVKMINSGDVYVNVHTEKHPEGEIRGQVKKE